MCNGCACVPQRTPGLCSGMENMIKSQKESIVEMTGRLQALQEEMEKVTNL